MTNVDNHKQWKIIALSEVLGDLNIIVEDNLTVGRNGDNNLVLASKRVSRNHASIALLKHKLFIKDLGSSNGTYVNNKALEANKALEIHEQDVISFAGFEFKVEALNRDVKEKPRNHNPLEESNIATNATIQANETESVDAFEHDCEEVSINDNKTETIETPITTTVEDGVKQASNTTESLDELQGIHLNSSINADTPNKQKQEADQNNNLVEADSSLKNNIKGEKDSSKNILVEEGTMGSNPTNEDIKNPTSEENKIKENGHNKLSTEIEAKHVDAPPAPTNPNKSIGWVIWIIFAIVIITIALMVV